MTLSGNACPSASTGAWPSARRPARMWSTCSADGKPASSNPKTANRPHRPLHLLAGKLFAIGPQPSQQMRDFLLFQRPAGIDTKPVGKARVQVSPDMRNGANFGTIVFRQCPVFGRRGFLQDIVGSRSAGCC